MGISEPTLFGMIESWLAAYHIVPIGTEMTDSFRVPMPHTGIVRIFDTFLGANLEPYRAKIHRYRLEQTLIRLGMVEAGSEDWEADYIDGLELFD